MAEEWFGGFPEWTAVIAGDGLEPARFLVINALGLLLFSAGTWAAFRDAGASWIVTSLAALVGLNAVLHVLATAAFARYSPGVVTGLLLYVPLSAAVLRSSATSLTRARFAGAVLGGVVLHGMVTLVAFA